MVAGFAATALITVSLFQFGVGIATARVDPVGDLPADAARVGRTTRIGGPILSALVFAVATVAVVMVLGSTVYGAGFAP